MHRSFFAGVLLCGLAAPAEGNVSIVTNGSSDEERAYAAAKEARKAYREGRKEEAIERYGAAWELFKDPLWMCDRGALEFEQGRPWDAAQHLSICLRLLKPEDKKVIGKKVERSLDEARARVGALTVKANVPDAEVVVNDKVVGKLPLLDPIFLSPGSHAVEVRAPGYQSDVRLAVLFAGRTLTIPMRLEPMRAEVAPPLESAPPEAKKEKPSAPVPPPMLPEKTMAPLPPSVGAVASAPVPVRASVVFAGLGLSVVGTAVGVGSFMASSAAQGEAKTKYRSLTNDGVRCETTTPDPCAEPEDAMDRAMGLTALGVTGIAVGLLGSGLIVYELVRPSTQVNAMNAQVAVTAAAGGGTLQLTGRF